MIDSFLNILKYNQSKPILFTHLFFWGFFVLVLLIYSFIYKNNKARTTFLFITSLYFYFKTSGLFILLLLFTIINDYYLGKKIAVTSNQQQKKRFLIISVCCNLFFLCFFKYAYFFTQSYNQIVGTEYAFFNHFAQLSNNTLNTTFRLDNVLPAIGVSFFTFQSLSYTIDLYRSKISPVKSLIDYGFFVCFFPHLVAGPIVKANEFIHQIYQPYKLNKQEFGMALFLILNGFGKKIVADYLAVNLIDKIFINPNYYSGLEVVFGVFGYSLQIYMDFSGYTDMAIGVALLFGYRLKTNFNSPYKATSTSEFWKRWHISLSSWLQEYLYIPLGGNKKGSAGSYICIAFIGLIMVLLSGKIWLLIILLILSITTALLYYKIPSFKQQINTNVNLMVTMLLGGLWHGSSWLFLIWGGLNGIGLIIHKYWQKISPFKNNESYLVKFLLMLVTLTFISFTRIFFRSSDLETVSTLISRIENQFGLNLFFDIITGYWPVMTALFLGYFIHWIPEHYKVKYRTWFSSQPIYIMGLIAVVFIFLMYQLMSSEMQPFIYFQF